MVKPICVIYFPPDCALSKNGKNIDTMELMKELNGWGKNENASYSHDDNRFGGYIYWCFTKEHITEPQFKVFHPKKFTKANYQELKDLILSSIQLTNVNEQAQ